MTLPRTVSCDVTSRTVSTQLIEADSGVLCLGGVLPRRADIVVSEVGMKREQASRSE